MAPLINCLPETFPFVIPALYPFGFYERDKGEHNSFYRKSPLFFLLSMQSYFIPNKSFSFNQFFKYFSVHIVLQALIYMAHSCTFMGFIEESTIRHILGRITVCCLQVSGHQKVVTSNNQLAMVGMLQWHSLSASSILPTNKIVKSSLLFVVTSFIPEAVP